jgi:hypothetical protein
VLGLIQHFARVVQWALMLLQRVFRLIHWTFMLLMCLLFYAADVSAIDGVLNVCEASRVDLEADTLYTNIDTADALTYAIDCS